MFVVGFNHPVSVVAQPEAALQIERVRPRMAGWQDVPSSGGGCPTSKGVVGPRFACSHPHGFVEPPCFIPLEEGFCRSIGVFQGLMDPTPRRLVVGGACDALTPSPKSAGTCRVGVGRRCWASPKGVDAGFLRVELPSGHGVVVCPCPLVPVAVPHHAPAGGCGRLTMQWSEGRKPPQHPKASD